MISVAANAAPLTGARGTMHHDTGHTAISELREFKSLGPHYEKNSRPNHAVRSGIELESQQADQRVMASEHCLSPKRA